MLIGTFGMKTCLWKREWFKLTTFHLSWTPYSSYYPAPGGLRQTYKSSHTPLEPWLPCQLQLRSTAERLCIELNVRLEGSSAALDSPQMNSCISKSDPCKHTGQVHAGTRLEILWISNSPWIYEQSRTMNRTVLKGGGSERVVTWTFQLSVSTTPSTSKCYFRTSI